MAESKKKDSKIMDVAHPGKTAPSENSKSVIVGHGPMMKDPMVIDGDSDKVESPKEDLSKRTSKSVIVPIGSDDQDDSKKEKSKSKSSVKAKSKHKLKEDDDKKTIAALAAEVDAEDVEDTESSDSEESDENNIPPVELPVIDIDEEDKTDKKVSDEKNEIEEDKQEKVDAEPDKVDSEEVDEENKNKETNPNEAELKNDEEEKHQKEIQKLAESKQYYLPINTIENRRSKRVVIFGIILSVILIIAWIDIALDAGLIELGGIKPVTSFFSN